MTVDWFDEAKQGGVTMIALAALSIGLVAFSIERLLRLGRGRIVPANLVPQLLKNTEAGNWEQARKQGISSQSILGDIAVYLIDHRGQDPQLVQMSAGDIGARAIGVEERRTVPFAVIAALAPLLGLLGTMIGMIESFKLVEVYGDEGGASLLAGSISKALITTAAGLVIAVPAVMLFHFFKTRTLAVGSDLEQESEELFDAWFVQPTRAANAAAPARVAPQAASAVKPASPGVVRPAGGVKP